VLNAAPCADGEVAEDQVFVLQLHGAVDPASVGADGEFR
jgi:hypothetical protein